MPIPSSLLESPFASSASVATAPVATGPILVATAGAELRQLNVRPAMSWSSASRASAFS